MKGNVDQGTLLASQPASSRPCRGNDMSQSAKLRNYSLSDRNFPDTRLTRMTPGIRGFYIIIIIHAEESQRGRRMEIPIKYLAQESRFIEFY